MGEAFFESLVVSHSIPQVVGPKDAGMDYFLGCRTKAHRQLAGS
jgi:hypothetical protein